MISYKDKYLGLQKDHTFLKLVHEDLRKESRSLVNYILRIRKKCENEHLWLMASRDPYKELTNEQQQGPLITKMFEMVQNVKRKIK
jgi:hypothetical protein